MDLHISGDKNLDYSEKNLVIKPDAPVAKITQKGNIPNVSLSDAIDFEAHGGISLENNNLAIPSEILATNAGYRVRCERLSRGESIALTVALATMKVPKPNERREFVVESHFSDGTSYWTGSPFGDVYGEKPVPKVVDVFGTFVVRGRRRTFSKRIDVTAFVRPTPNAGR